MFVGTIRQKPQYEGAFIKLVSILENEGHEVIHKHVTSNEQSDLDKMSIDQDSDFHSNILKNIQKSDIVVSEVSSNSLSVGYLLSYAASSGKPLLVFYHSKTDEPNLFRSLAKNSSKIFLVKYSSLDELNSLILEYVEYAKDQVDVRFNFFIPPSIGNYLDWISKTKKVPRSVYLRNLIEKDMTKNEKYHSKDS